MKLAGRRAVTPILLCFLLINYAFSSAYNARPKLVVIIVIDQFRADYLERFRDQFGEGGFRLLLDRGANFTNCNYDYADTRTAPGHATLATGAYPNSHGILDNQWWDSRKRAMVSSVQDDGTKLVGISSKEPGASPHNLLADTLADELKLATQGRARVFAVALKDRSAILSAGFSGDGAYWIDGESGTWITSTYYRSSLPKWAQEFNDAGRAKNYLNKEWRNRDGKLLRSTKPGSGNPSSFYELVGSTPFGNDYELEFARELVTSEKLGTGAVSDLLIVSLSSNDILGHYAGPDSPEVQAMTTATDQQLAAFFNFLDRRVGLANIWIAVSADHGVSPVTKSAAGLRIPAWGAASEKLRAQINQALSARFSQRRSADYLAGFDYPFAWLNEKEFAAIKINEEDAERAVGDALNGLGLRGYYTRTQLQHGDVPHTEMGRKYEHSYSPLGGWYVIGVPAPFTVGVTEGADHGSPYTYDTHVPLLFYGPAFQPGTYRTHAEPVDLAATLASVLGVNPPTHAVGRVLTEALAPVRRASGPQQ
jgi:predicted AlkP superfamily pyrophosphatase or phosphodiesterase